jgi:FKBP-type peptidyl-prolyl cis-trans isomerase
MQNKKGNKSIIVSVIVVVCFIGVIIYAVKHKKAEVIEDNTGAVASQVAPVDTQVQPVADTSKNMEQISKNGDTLVMNYTGRFTDGKVFDSNVDPKFGHVQPFEFTLGAGQVIAGWDEGLVGMKVGEKKTLTVTPDKGYGPKDYHGIPGNSTLIFDVELVGIK